MTENELPQGWTAGIGEKGPSYLDQWWYHNDYELHLWWDKGNDYAVEIIPIMGYNELGGSVYDYPIETCEFETYQEAEEYAFELMEKYSGD